MSIVPPDALQELENLLPTGSVDFDSTSCQRASRDYFWLSPVLKQTLENRPIAEAVVKPRTVETLQACLAWAFRNEVPITPRGKGTGNYGQAVPYDGGVVIDLSRMDKILAIEDDWITAEAGSSFAQLEAAANAAGQELQLIPSTIKSTLGGFLSGGNGGAGSVSYGMIWNGFVDTLRIVPCTKEAFPFDVSGDACLPYLHAYGTTGIICQAKVRLRPKRNWSALFFSFDPDQVVAAANASLELVKLSTPPRLNSFDLASTVAFFNEDPRIPHGRISLRSIIDRPLVPRARAIVENHGGQFEADEPDSIELLQTHSFNHPTLRIKQKRPDFCHLQIKGPDIVEHLTKILSLLPEATCHFDSRREPGNVDSFGAILLSRFESETLLEKAIAAIRSLGLHVINVHDHHLGGGHPPSLELIHKTRRQTDPKGLLNSGRLPSSKKPVS